MAEDSRASAPSGPSGGEAPAGGAAGSSVPEEAVGRVPGWREVLIVGAVVVVVVLGLAFGTSLLPSGLQDIVFRTPLTIIVLVAGTVGLLIWIARRPTPRV